MLAGGTGSRLWPITKVVSKQLLPVYNKPMIYYPISTLMLAGIRDILIITTERDQPSFKQLLGDGGKFGVRFSYKTQAKPEGIAQSFIIGKDFLGGEDCMLVLGDNIFHGVGLGNQLQGTLARFGCHIFTYEVADPENYGVLGLSKTGEPYSIEEKPENPASKLAITGLYSFDSEVSRVAEGIKPSARGELEITSIISTYMHKGALGVTQLNRGTAWLDTGTPKSLHDAATYIRIIEERTGQMIACLEEIAWRNGYISDHELEKLGSGTNNSELRSYIFGLLSV